MAELCRWRLWNHTGGGLMAELGSHQLDAAGIFVSALRKDGKKAHPLTVHAVGGRHLFPPARQAGDHVYCMFEFPGPAYDPDFPVGYSDKVNNVPDPRRGSRVTTKTRTRRSSSPTPRLMATGSAATAKRSWAPKGRWCWRASRKSCSTPVRRHPRMWRSRTEKRPDDGHASQWRGGTGGRKRPQSSGPVSRGYTEEIEHWAWCIRNPDPENVPRCHPEVALSDAVIALTTNVAVRQANEGKSGYIQFQESWYDIDER